MILSRRLSFLTTILLLGLSAAMHLVPASVLAESRMLELGGGRSVKLLSISEIEFSKGVKALLIRYETGLAMDREDELGREADAIFEVMGGAVAAAKVTKAVVSPNEVPRGLFITGGGLLNFICEKDSTGKWKRVDSNDLVATPNSGAEKRAGAD